MQAIDHLHRGQVQTARDTRLIAPAPPLIGTGTRGAGYRGPARTYFSAAFQTRKLLAAFAPGRFTPLMSGEPSPVPTLRPSRPQR
jgi:hypothetical protein